MFFKIFPTPLHISIENNIIMMNCQCIDIRFVLMSMQTYLLHHNFSVQWLEALCEQPPWWGWSLSRSRCMSWFLLRYAIVTCGLDSQQQEEFSSVAQEEINNLCDPYVPSDYTKNVFCQVWKKKQRAHMLIVYNTHLNNIKLLKILDKGRWCSCHYIVLHFPVKKNI